ncbi:MAG: hypothetical protein K0M55_02775 [Rhizobium sp.]|nr:hypothetical protein [Rhizobium sp.]MBW8321145.1 hypothetical protein [Rhizobium sp.]MBW8447899.1 hypothetical protein [Arenimonas sp.]
MTFAEAFALHGPDTIAIGKALGIPEHEADRLINRRMDERAQRRAHWKRTKAGLAEIRRQTQEWGNDHA